MRVIYKSVVYDLHRLIEKADANNRHIEAIVLLQSEWDSLVKENMIEADCAELVSYFMGVKIMVGCNR